MANFSLKKKHNWHWTKHVFLSFSWFKKLPQETLGSVHAFIATHQKKKINFYLFIFFPIPIQIDSFHFSTGKEKNNILNGDQANQSLKN